MLTYIKQLAVELFRSPNTADRVGWLNPFVLGRTLTEELNRLEPRDFSPDARFAFVLLRAEMRSLTEVPGNYDRLKILARDVQPLLERYGMTGKGPASRTFRWLSADDLKSIVVRDYAELSSVLVPDGAWKSAVVMAGSILEAILLDLLVYDPARLAAAKASPKAPKDARTGATRSEDDWQLFNLIEIATDIRLLPQDRAKTFDQVLRDYRNFVHPRKERRAAHACGEGEALMAKGALDAVCDHFDRVLP